MVGFVWQVKNVWPTWNVTFCYLIFLDLLRRASQILEAQPTTSRLPLRSIVKQRTHMSLATNNIFSALDGTAPKKSKAKVDAVKKKSAAEDRADKKAATAELEKAIFAQPLSSSAWADDDDEEDGYEGTAREPEEDGWSNVKVRYAMPPIVHSRSLLCPQAGAPRVPIVTARDQEEESDQDEEEDEVGASTLSDASTHACNCAM